MGSTFSGSPVGRFNTSARVGLAASTNNQQVIAAPAAGFSIYVQTISGGASGLAAATFTLFHPAGGTAIAEFDLDPTVQGGNLSFPGGYMLPAATALQADVGGQATAFNVTYTVGPTL